MTAVLRRSGKGWGDETGAEGTDVTHKQSMSARLERDERDPNPACEGKLRSSGGGFWDDVRWRSYECEACGIRINTVGGGVHQWNHVSELQGVSR